MIEGFILTSDNHLAPLILSLLLFFKVRKNFIYILLFRSMNSKDKQMKLYTEEDLISGELAILGEQLDFKKYYFVS